MLRAILTDVQLDKLAEEPMLNAYSPAYRENMQTAFNVLRQDLLTANWDMASEHLKTFPKKSTGWHGAYNWLLVRVRQEIEAIIAREEIRKLRELL